MPDSALSEVASAGSCALRSVINAFDKACQVDFMSCILVIGSRPLGLLVTAVASWFNPQSLDVVGAPPARLELAWQWGASATGDIGEHPDPVERAALGRELTGGGPNIVFEMAGSRTDFVEG